MRLPGVRAWRPQQRPWPRWGAQVQRRPRGRSARRQVVGSRLGMGCRTSTAAESARSQGRQAAPSSGQSPPALLRPPLQRPFAWQVAANPLGTASPTSTAARLARPRGQPPHWFCRRGLCFPAGPHRIPRRWGCRRGRPAWHPAAASRPGTASRTSTAGRLARWRTSRSRSSAPMSTRPSSRSWSSSSRASGRTAGALRGSRASGTSRMTTCSRGT
mmetsp:Transcript_7485/g.23802  ORF Transcript_7485/g.23802 Transcript_7485/m.23802 type:complete len:216 (+) Transcript_7485:379-1026(+)